MIHQVIHSTSLEPATAPPVNHLGSIEDDLHDSVLLEFFEQLANSSNRRSSCVAANEARM
jgi:hypothetical protein